MNPPTMKQYRTKANFSIAPWYKSFREGHTLLQLLGDLGRINPTTLEFHRNDNGTGVRICEEHDVVTPTTAYIVIRECQIRVNDDSTARDTLHGNTTTVFSTRIAEVLLPHA